MDFTKKYNNPNPVSKANFISRLFFLWEIPLFRKGLRKDLEIEDLYNAKKQDLSEPLADALEKNWNNELRRAKQENRKPKLLKAIYATFWKLYAFWGILLFIQAVILKTIIPVSLAKLIEYFNSESTLTLQDGYKYACIMITSSIIATVIFFHAYLDLQLLGMRCRIACCSLMYRKYRYDVYFHRSFDTKGISIYIFVLPSIIYYVTLIPISLAALLQYFNRSSLQTTKDLAYDAATILLVASIATTLLKFHADFTLQLIGMRLRIASCSLLYRKMLRLSYTALGETAVGKVVNLMSNDVNRFDQTPMFLHYIWITPIQAVVISYFMYESVGVAAFGGIAVISLQAILVQGYISRKTAQLRMHIAHRTDERVRIMNEIIAGIQVIKMYAWEKPFEAVVRQARKCEIDLLQITSYFRGFSLALMVYTERLSLYVTIITFVLMGNDISGDKVFSMAQFFNILQLFLAIFFPNALVYRGEALISIKRIEQFMLQEENVNLSITSQNGYSDVEHNGSINLKNISAAWVPNQIYPTLNEINLNVKPGQLYAIIGPVGSGKSSILQLLLKELPVRSGTMTIEGKVSYSSQEPWLFQGSIRNNILFGQPFNKEKYNETVEVCALLRDFEQLPYDDKTLVGDRGSALSGGQKARVNLARAVYKDADIYLFDDPLSAVDTHVGKHLFEKCIYQYLSKKTRILVTHQLQYLKKADLIIVLDNGCIKKTGTWDEISEDTEIIENIKSSHEAQKEHEYQRSLSVETQHRKRLYSEVSSQGTIQENNDEEPQETQELMEKGTLNRNVFLEYLKAGGGIFFLCFTVLLFLIAQSACSGSDYWLTFWTNNENVRRHYLSLIDFNVTTPTPLNITTTINISVAENDTLLGDFADKTIPTQEFTIYIYTVLIILSVLMTTFSRFVFYKLSMNSSIRLHDKMFNNILQATMRFFDTNPSGRILNRFSKDMGATDELLPRALLETIQIFLVMFGILTMVAIVNPYLILVMIVMGILFYIIREVYMRTAQDIKRLEGITRSPVFSHVSASLDGMTTIRAYQAQSLLQKEFDQLQDVHTGSWYLTIATSMAFGFWLDCVSITFLAVVSFSFLILDDGVTFSGNVGLAISQSLILTGMLQYGMRQTAEVMNQMTSVERILQYTKLEKEGPFESEPGKKPISAWPELGAIKFEHTFLTYIPNEDPVLKDLNIDILPGDKIGIVGRTGAGKSSLIAALFRLAPLNGEIYIDDIPIKSVGLTDLRSRISIIPQQPVLFSSTLRNNLDPFNKCDDATLWQALEEVELKEITNDLSHKVQEGGSNFSAGQRQLLCLARAIVRNNKILIMDEATANVDPNTDSLIQSTIRKKFAACTVLTIAHRLNTIMDSDKVLVMEAGQVVEYDHPYLLLQNNDGYFAKMVAETGTKMENELRSVAKISYDKQTKKL